MFRELGIEEVGVDILIVTCPETSGGRGQEAGVYDSGYQQ